MAYPVRPKLSAITQQMTLNTAGLVADAIFPKVQTDCKFAVVDWTAELKDMKAIDDHVTCKSDVNEIDTGALELLNFGTKDHALSQVLDECCVSICGDDGIKAKIEAQKTRSLTNKLLIGREARAIALATDSSKYVDNTTKTPSDDGAVIDGGLFKLDKSDFNDPNFELARYMMGVNEYAQFGRRNILVSDLATINGLLTHPRFIGSGCAIDPMTNTAKVASILGVSKVVIADAAYNDGIGENISMKKFWPKDTILMVSSSEFITSQDPQFAFGLTAYTQPIQQHTWIDEEKGKGAGALMQKIGHDMTEIVLSYKAATLIKLV